MQRLNWLLKIIGDRQPKVADVKMIYLHQFAVHSQLDAEFSGYVQDVPLNTCEQ
jgi:hypothetical protein